MLTETRYKKLFQVSPGGLSEASNKEVLLNPCKLKIIEYVLGGGGGEGDT